jgi:hypothetical protein
LLVIEQLYKNTDDNGVSNEIGGSEWSKHVRANAKDSIQNVSNYLT